MSEPRSMFGSKLCKACGRRITALWNRCPSCGELAGRASRPEAEYRPPEPYAPPDHALVGDGIVPPCESCRAYQAGERDNLLWLGTIVHACDRIPNQSDGMMWASSCPCGCVEREPGLLAHDRRLYGNAFVGPGGARIDPTTVRPAS